MRPGESTHRELEPTNIFSLVSSLTPFPDFNQSPRNMYQCQMGKQTMGIPSQTLPYRADNKLYVLNGGQVMHTHTTHKHNTQTQHTNKHTTQNNSLYAMLKEASPLARELLCRRKDQ